MTRRAVVAAIVASTICVAIPDLAPAGPDRRPGHGPAERHARTGRAPRIYRVRVVVTSAAPWARVSLDEPAVLIEGRGTLSKGPGTIAEFDGYGGAITVTGRGTRRRPSKAGFVIALSPLGARRLRFISVRDGKGRIEVAVSNLNRDRPVPIARAVHRHGKAHVLRVPLRKIAARGPARGTAPLRPRVLAFYYAWYRGTDWIDGSKPTARDNTNPTPYDSADTGVIRRHFAQAAVAGIEGFIVSWWGEGTPSDQNLPSLFAGAPRGFDIALYLEAQGHRFRTQQELVDQLDYALDRYGRSPRYLRIDHRPVVYVYSSRAVLRGAGEGDNPTHRAVWKDALRRLAARGHRPILIGDGTDPRDLSVFGGLHTYWTNPLPDETEIERRMALAARAYAAVQGGRRRVWASSVFPGFDDRHLRGPQRPYVARDGGSFYAAQWWRAIGSDPDQVLVVSFNEWPESTNIEPNAEWKDHYLHLTAAWAGRFRRAR